MELFLVILEMSGRYLDNTSFHSILQRIGISWRDGEGSVIVYFPSSFFPFQDQHKFQVFHCILRFPFTLTSSPSNTPFLSSSVDFLLPRPFPSSRHKSPSPPIPRPSEHCSWRPPPPPLRRHPRRRSEAPERIYRTRGGGGRSPSRTPVPWASSSSPPPPPPSLSSCCRASRTRTSTASWSS